GLGLSALFGREARGHARQEAVAHVGSEHVDGGLSTRRVFALMSLREPALAAASQAGLVNNLNDGLAWGLLPIYYAAAGLGVAEIGVLAAIYPAVWAISQVGTGAWSDRIGRKPLIVAGMLLQAGAIAAIAVGSTFAI